MKNNYYKILFLSLFINMDIDKSKARRTPGYYHEDRENKKFLKGR